MCTRQKEVTKQKLKKDFEIYYESLENYSRLSIIRTIMDYKKDCTPATYYILLVLVFFTCKHDWCRSLTMWLPVCGCARAGLAPPSEHTAGSGCRCHSSWLPPAGPVAALQKNCRTSSQNERPDTLTIWNPCAPPCYRQTIFQMCIFSNSGQ